MAMGLRITGPWIVPQMNIDTLPDQLNYSETRRKFRLHQYFGSIFCPGAVLRFFGLESREPSHIG